jgi:hypothetical protein
MKLVAVSNATWERIGAALDRPEQREPAIGQGAIMLSLTARPSRGPVSYAWVAVGAPRVLPVTVRELSVPHADPDRVSVCDVEVKPSVIYRCIQQAQGLSIPILLVDPPTAGLDGTAFSVAMDFGGTATRVRFWGSGPDEWRHFAAWAKATMQYLHDCVAPGSHIDLGV